EADLLDRPRQVAIVRRSRDRDVELGVETHVVGLDRRARHLVERALYRHEIALVTRYRSPPRHDRLENAAVVEKLRELRPALQNTADELLHDLLVLARLEHERSP